VSVVQEYRVGPGRGSHGGKNVSGMFPKLDRNAGLITQKPIAAAGVSQLLEQVRLISI
jgi:hypothetical protein